MFLVVGADHYGGAVEYHATCKCVYEAVEEFLHVLADVRLNLDYDSWNLVGWQDDVEGDINAIANHALCGGDDNTCCLFAFDCRGGGPFFGYEDPDCCCGVKSLMESYVSHLKAIADRAPTSLYNALTLSTVIEDTASLICDYNPDLAGWEIVADVAGP